MLPFGNSPLCGWVNTGFVSLTSNEMHRGLLILYITLLLRAFSTGFFHDENTYFNLSKVYTTLQGAIHFFKDCLNLNSVIRHQYCTKISFASLWSFLSVFCACSRATRTRRRCQNNVRVCKRCFWETKSTLTLETNLRTVPKVLRQSRHKFMVLPFNRFTWMDGN